MADPSVAVPAQTTQGQSYTVAPGDTLSALGSKLGVNWQDLYQANKATIGANPNIIRPGMVLNVPGQGGSQGSSSTGTTGNTTDFKLDIPNTVDSGTLNKALTNPITSKDLEDAIAANKTLQASITTNSAPSQKETDLSSQIQTLKNQEATAKLNLQKYENALPGEGISAGAISGRSSSMARDVNLDIQTLVLQEKTLADELGVETKSRTGNLAADKASFANNEKVIADYDAMQRVITSQQNQINSQSKSLGTQALNLLKTISEQFKTSGIKWADLSPDTQAQLTKYAQDAGLPIETVQAQMDANANQAKLNTIKTQNNIIKQNIQIQKEPPSPKGTVSSGSLKALPGDMSSISSTLEHGDSKNNAPGRGSDGYANTETYVRLMNAWINKGGLAQDFIKHFPPKSYLNPSDPTVPAYLK